MIILKHMFSKPLWWSGWLLLLLGLAHVPAWLLSGTDWEGSVSWRKPILFGVSTGMTLCSLGWLADHIDQRFARLTACVAWVTSIALVCEVALITLQQWRGVASHFNNATEFDSRVDLAMFVLICIAGAGVFYFFVRCFGKLDLDPDYAIAIRSGMLLLMISCVIGFVISSYGYQRVSANLPPEIVEESGVTKFPHGIAIHALQILPGIVWVMRRFSFRRESKNLVVWCLSISFAIQIAFAIYQTVNGYSRFQLDGSFSLFLAGLALLTAVFPVVIVSWKEVAGRLAAGK